MLLRVSHVLLSCGERRSGGIARGAGGTHVLDAVEQCEQTARVGAAHQTQGAKLPWPLRRKFRRPLSSSG